MKSIAARGASLAIALALFTTGSDARRLDCEELTQLMSTGNTSVTSATVVSSGTLTVGNSTLSNLPGFCRVQGTSKPGDDSNIFFEVWLPFDWNGRFLTSGEGGYAGSPNYTRNGLDGGLDELVRRGYVTASTDTGHNASNGTFWAIGHPGRQIDYLHRSKHLVTVAAKKLIKAFYGRAQSYSYFNSCSNGGRQALVEAQRYPDDYDGYVVGAPWNYQSHSNAGFVWNAQAMSAPGASIPAAKLPAIHDSVLAACDGTDGLVDGVIADPLACNWNPGTLLCSGAETNACLTPPQLEALRKIYSGPFNPRTGKQIFPGFILGGERGWNGIVGNTTASGLERGYFNNLAFEDQNWDFRTFNFDSDMMFADMKVGTLGNSIEADLTPARKRGAKFIQYHGWNDQTLQPEYSPQYYEAVIAETGSLQKTQDFYRLFMVPGMTHCYFGLGAATAFGGVGQQLPPVRDAAHDIQKALELWVEHGIAPDRIIATKYATDAAANRQIMLQRPLCPYPTVPQYNGAGDPNSVDSFMCVAGTRIAPLDNTAP